jgi:predicted acylesterase/phospholipase RssA
MTTHNIVFCFFLFTILKYVDCFHQLSFSGGGSFGAVEIGIIKRLQEIENKNFDIYTGISAGGLNAGFLSYFYDLKLGIKEAENLYSKMTSKMVYECYPKSGLSLLNTEPLYKTLYDITENMRDEPVVNTLIGATNLYTGDLDIYNYCDIEKEERVQLLMATSAIPIFFPPVAFRNKLYADGGTLSNELLDVVHNVGYLNITFITPSDGLLINNTPITNLKEMIIRTTQIITSNFNNPISKINQNCKTPYGEINKYFVNDSLLAGYSMLNFDKGAELIDIGYKNVEHKKYVLC